MTEAVHYPFPSIEQFRHVVKKVTERATFAGLDENDEQKFDPTAKRPILHFEGTVKLHGTNAAIVFPPEGGVQFQSRERVLSAESDNAGFFAHFAERSDAVRNLWGVAQDLYRVGPISIYGEWCGGNIQKGVAITGLPKMFVIFAVRCADLWLPVDGRLENTDAGVYCITNFPRFEIDIDFESPHDAQNELVDITNSVEAQCPVGSRFDRVGTGEGVVWRCTTPGWESSQFWFKVKGEKHSETKVKTLAEVDVEALRQVGEFVARVVTDARLEHALQHLTAELQKPFEMPSMGDFLRLVFNDILKEEADTIAASGFDTKKLGGPISLAAKRWFIARLNGETK